MSTRTEQTLTPLDIAEGYQQIYHAIHGRTPHVLHMGGYWYKVNGEIVHRTTLIQEITRLRELRRQQYKQKLDGNVLSRLIRKLRAV
jgi:hypothetical protein